MRNTRLCFDIFLKMEVHCLLLHFFLHKRIKSLCVRKNWSHVNRRVGVVCVFVHVCVYMGVGVYKF